MWTDGDKHHAIINSGYADANSALERILRRFDGGQRHYANLRAKIGELAEPGNAITTVLGRHRVGLMRPYLAGEPGTAPFVICREARAMFRAPVICASQDHAHAFALTASDAEGLSRKGWLGFAGERLRSPIERLFTNGAGGRVQLRSELEEELGASLAAARAVAIEAQTIRAHRKPTIKARRTTSPKPTRPGRPAT